MQHLIRDGNSTTSHDNSDNLEINGASGDVALAGKHISLPLKSTSISGGKIHIKLHTFLLSFFIQIRYQITPKLNFV